MHSWQTAPPLCGANITAGSMAGTTTTGKIDVHFHLIPQFYRDAVYEAGSGPAIGRYPDWTPQFALELYGQARHLACGHLDRAAGGWLPAERQALGFCPPLQRLHCRLDRATPQAVRLLRPCADARHRRRDRGGALLPRYAASSKAFRCSQATGKNFSATRPSIRCWNTSTNARPSSTFIRACIRQAARSRCHGRAL